MNGASAELWENTMRNPRSNTAKTIGVSHHFFRTRKKPQSSLNMENFDPKLMAFSIYLINIKTADLSYLTKKIHF